MGIDYSWKAVLADGDVKNSVQDKFDLSWELPGAVRSFSMIYGAIKATVNLENGQFSLGDSSDNPLPGNFGDFALRYFKRVRKHFGPAGNLVGEEVIGFLGYKKGEAKEILMVISENQEQTKIIYGER